MAGLADLIMSDGTTTFDISYHSYVHREGAVFFTPLLYLRYEERACLNSS